MPAPSRPKYVWIKEDLAERIERKEFAAGQALPSQASLSRHYGVTLMTLRQALRNLQDEGLIVQRPGHGTFVTPVPMLDLTYLSSLADELAAQGVALETSVLDCAVRVLPADVATQLSREPGDPALRLERLRRIEDVPVVHQVSWVPAPWAETLRDADFAKESLYGALAIRSRVAVVSATETLRAQSLPRAPAKAGGLKAGRPTLLAERITYDTTGAAVVLDVATLLNESLSVVVQRAQRQTKLAWMAGQLGP